MKEITIKQNEILTNVAKQTGVLFTNGIIKDTHIETLQEVCNIYAAVIESLQNEIISFKERGKLGEDTANTLIGIIKKGDELIESNNQE